MRAVARAQTGFDVSSAAATLLFRLIGVISIALVLTLLTESFLTLPNILNVLRQASLTFLIASGLTLVILSGGLDLSVGANVGLTACIAATVIQASESIGLGVAAALTCGATIGALNGLVVTRLRVPPFIATYGMLWVLNGITYWYMAGETLYGFPPALRAVGSGYIAGVPTPIYLMAASLIVGTLFTRYTTYGHEILAIGANAEAARLSGVPILRRLNLVYIVSGVMAGLAAFVYLARLNSAEPDIGEPLTLPAIAAVLVGGTSLFGGSGSIAGTFVGALILTLVLNGMNLLVISANWQPLVTGVILILAVWIDIQTRERAELRT